MTAVKRRELIPEIRAHIAQHVPGTAEAVNRAIDRWRDGEQSSTPWEAGVFSACDQVARAIDARASMGTLS